jgi:hypothetical protein
LKTGIIVYILGSPANDFDVEHAKDFDEENTRRALDIDADHVEFVFSGDNNFDVPYAWYRLTIKGMRRIICMTAQMISTSALRLTGAQLQLCAY